MYFRSARSMRRTMTQSTADSRTRLRSFPFSSIILEIQQGRRRRPWRSSHQIRPWPLAQRSACVAPRTEYRYVLLGPPGFAAVKTFTSAQRTSQEPEHRELDGHAASGPGSEDAPGSIILVVPVNAHVLAVRFHASTCPTEQQECLVARTPGTSMIDLQRAGVDVEPLRNLGTELLVDLDDGHVPRSVARTLHCLQHRPLRRCPRRTAHPQDRMEPRQAGVTVEVSL